MSTAESRMSGYVNKLEQQRDELIAQNERLREALTRVSKQSELDICTRLDIGSNGVRDYYISIASEALAETPAQSLEALKNEWLKGNAMNFGEHLESDDKGSISGLDTGRLVATFSHVSEGESFVECYNNLAGW